MKNNTVLGMLAGFAVGAAAAVVGMIAVDKVVKEIKVDLCDQSFTSPEGNNKVTLSYGSSDTAKGLTYVKVIATTESKEDECKLVILTKKSEPMFAVEWTDNNNCKILVGNGKHKQCCDVKFDGDQLFAQYYVK